jgi:lipid-A-disaccharide synthase
MKYYIIAGEASGDLHGSNLIRGLQKSDQEAQFRLWGGDLMEQAGGKLVRNYRDLAFMGYIEVLRNIRVIKRNLDFCKHDIIQYSPDVLILIDYPGFNLKIAQFGKEHGFRVFYYISPKVWAWKEGRVKKIKRYVDRMFSILPFEVEYYKKFQMPVEYQGNPVLDAVTRAEQEMENREAFLAKNQLPDKPIIGLIPGSRKQEIKYNLPVMLQTIHSYPGYQFLITCSPMIDRDYYLKLTGGYEVQLIYGQTYSVMKYAEAALITSGTATLEAAQLRVPQVVCYRANLIGMLIAYFLVKVSHISLVNLIMEEEVVKELVQYKLTPTSLKTELDRLLNDRQYRQTMLDNYEQLHDRIGPPGVSERIAARMVDILTG